MYKTFGETIASLRRAHGMRQQTLADALAEAGVPVSNQAVSKWENDATLPNAQQFLTLCRVLDVDDIAGTFSGGDAGGLLAGLNAEGRRRALEYIALLRERGFTGECLNVVYEPVTGAHVGPGTVALFFYGTEK